jgi:hypothetical protein
LALGLLFLFLSGCAASFKGFPDQPINPEAEIAALSEYLMPDVAAKYASANPADRGGLSREAWRNEVIDARLRAIDLRYNEWEQRLYQEQVETAFGTDLLLLGLTGAGAVSGASNVLSAAAVGVTGARASIDRNAYYNRTLPALIAWWQNGSRFCSRFAMAKTSPQMRTRYMPPSTMSIATIMPERSPVLSPT